MSIAPTTALGTPLCCAAVTGRNTFSGLHALFAQLTVCGLLLEQRDLCSRNYGHKSHSVLCGPDDLRLGGLLDGHVIGARGGIFREIRASRCGPPLHVADCVTECAATAV